VTYTFVTVTDAKFFRFESVAIDARTVNIVTVEKTLVDYADHPEYCDGILELTKGLANATDLDEETLSEQLLDLGNGAGINASSISPIFSISILKGGRNW
jgi:Predicted transcriptional regulator